MGRSLLAVLCAVLLTACDDPLIIIGDLPGFMRITAGIPDSAGTRLDSLALRTRLSFPGGIAADSAGVLYIADFRSRLFRVTSDGRIERLLNQDPCFIITCIGRAQGMSIATGGMLLIADDMNDRIWRFNPVNRELVALAGTGTNGVAPDGTLATQADLDSPTDVVQLPDGRVAFAERNNNRIRVIDTDGRLGTLAGTGVLAEAGEGVPFANAPLSLPTGLGLQGNTLYVSETGSMTIRALDLAAGTIRKVGGTGLSGFSGDNGPAVQATFNYPADVAILDHNLFISDQNNHRVRVINLQTGIVSTFAGTASTVFSGNGRAAGETSLLTPRGLAVSRFGFLYIADSGHHIVWRTPVRANLQ